MTDTVSEPDSTAVRTALWRALHVEVDAPPHVIDDRIGLQLAAPDPDWRRRPDMNEYATPGVRASIVARARFVDDLVTDQADRGVEQYVLLGAGLDTFAQRRPEIASRITVFEVDRPAIDDRAEEAQLSDVVGTDLAQLIHIADRNAVQVYLHHACALIPDTDHTARAQPVGSEFLHQRVRIERGLSHSR